uniref:Uncharacterized protein n=1 Tax=Oryza glumipatula TaxID=40148 RepID=A0A0E0A3K4_9ORYZ
MCRRLSLGTRWPNGPFDCFLQMMMVSQSCSLSQPPTIFSCFSMTIAFTTVRFIPILALKCNCICLPSVPMINKYIWSL